MDIDTNDVSDNYEDTWSFLDRRIENVMMINKAKAGFSNFFNKVCG
jgi:ubiquinone biosynthesis protein COQ9